MRRKKIISPDRQPKGGEYYFVKLSDLKPCVTKDCYFDSDDEKYEAGNYFLTRAAVHDIVDTLHERFDKRISDVRRGTVENEHRFIKLAIELREKYHLATSKAQNDLAVDALLKLTAEYSAEKRTLEEERKAVREGIADAILKAPKQ